MIKPLKLGKLNFDNHLIQGPLAGVSHAPFRALTAKYSKPAFVYTEMISCKTILHQDKTKLQRFIAKDPQEGAVCFQLSANNPQELGEAVKYVTAAGADLIDLNCGCPVNKIRSKGAGSKLLEQPEKLFNMIVAMKQNTHVPVSIKIRIQHDDALNQQIADVINQAAPDFVTVHGRHWTEHYETPVYHDKIRFFVTQLNMPVIGNGDIACVNSLQAMLATGCAGAMIGRAGVGQPWLIAKLKAELQQQTYLAPSTTEIAEMFITHIEQLANLLGGEKFAVMNARKFAKYYARRLPDRNAFCAQINACDNLADFKKIVRQTFESAY